MHQELVGLGDYFGLGMRLFSLPNEACHARATQTIEVKALSIMQWTSN